MIISTETTSTDQPREAIFILGGGIMQLPAIEAARRLGTSVHVADGNAQCPGRSEADVFHHVDLRATDDLVRTARAIPNIAAIFTAGTDFSTSVAHVAQALGLPGITPDVAKNATDKARMRTVLQAAGVPVPRFFPVGPDESIRPDELDLRFPLVVKPVDNMGARGVILVHTPEEMLSAVKQARAVSNTRRVILEEFIPGREYSLDALVVEQRIEITGIADRHIYFSPYFVELGHTLPATLTPAEKDLLEETFCQAIRALGITSGAAKGDIFLDRNGPDPRCIVGEVAARLSGGYMSGWTFPLATGVPVTQLGLRIALGEIPAPEAFAPVRNQYAVERALISCPGTVAKIALPPDIDASVDAHFIRCNAGDRVKPPANNVEKLANVITSGKTPAIAEERALQTLEKIRVYLEPSDPETDRFLFHPEGAGCFARYTPGPSPLPWYIGSVEEIRRLLNTGSPLAILDDPVLRNCPAAYPALDAEKTLEILRRRGKIRIVATIEPTGVALGRLFWSAFRAAGQQGVDYLFDTLRTGSIPQEIQ